MVHDFPQEQYVNRVKMLKAEMQWFVLSPQNWRNYTLTHHLTWQSVKFEDANSAAVPLEKGVYAFVVSHDNGYFPPHGFIMYIGIAGIGGSKRTLRARYKDYIRERTRCKRRPFYFMLNAYQDDLVFVYATVTDPAIKLEEIETALNDAIIPPMNKKDFSADMRSALAAFR